jgi:3-methyladenine DNA glycosylase AlkD
MELEPTAAKFLEQLKPNQSGKVRMGDIFKLAKVFIGMPLPEVAKLLKNETHEARVGAVSIMDFQARDKKVPADQKKAVYNLYLDQHDFINTWDLVDRSAIYVVGGYLFDKSRAELYKLAESKDPMRRRTAILATAYFIRQDDLDDTYKIAETLLNDDNDLVHKGVGWMLRFAGDKDQGRLTSFLDKHATYMPRVMLRYAIEKLDKTKREYYLKLK